MDPVAEVHAAHDLGPRAWPGEDWLARHSHNETVALGARRRAGGEAPAKARDLGAAGGVASERPPLGVARVDQPRPLAGGVDAGEGRIGPPRVYVERREVDLRVSVG